MIGLVDESLRALLDISVAATADVPSEPLTVWIDTAFNGGLVIPHSQIARLRLKQAATTQAILADGQVVDLETYSCFLEWFGAVYQTQVIANDGAMPLLGTMLLADRKLMVDYRTKVVTLD